MRTSKFGMFGQNNQPGKTANNTKSGDLSPLSEAIVRGKASEFFKIKIPGQDNDIPSKKRKLLEDTGKYEQPAASKRHKFRSQTFNATSTVNDLYKPFFDGCNIDVENNPMALALARVAHNGLTDEKIETITALLEIGGEKAQQEIEELSNNLLENNNLNKDKQPIISEESKSDIQTATKAAINITTASHAPK